MNFRLIVLPLALGLGLTGCLSKSPLARQTYAFQAAASISRPADAGQGVLALKPCEVSPLFAGKALVYRIGPDAYETDPYAGFLISPDSALAIPIRSYLRGTGLFSDVVEPGSAIHADHALEIHVSELYGDFRQNGQPAAVLSMRLILLDTETGGTNKVVFAKDYSRRSPISQNTAAAVVAGWNQALGDILAEAVSDITASRHATAAMAP